MKEQTEEKFAADSVKVQQTLNCKKITGKIKKNVNKCIDIYIQLI